MADRHPRSTSIGQAAGRGRSVQVTRCGDVVVARPQGVFDAESIEGLDQVVGDTDEAVVIDLTDCTLSAPTEALGGLDPARWRRRGGAQTCVVFYRLSARELLSRAGVTERLACSIGSRTRSKHGSSIATATVRAGCCDDPLGQYLEERPPPEPDRWVRHCHVGARPLLTVSVEVDHVRAISRLAVAGELCSASAPTLAVQLDELIAAGVDRVSVDLSGLVLCTAAGVAVFADARKRLEASNGSLRLHDARGVVSKVLDLCSLDHDSTKRWGWVR